MEKVLLQDDLMSIGSFELGQDESAFTQQGYVATPIFVFPKNSIWIQHEGSLPFVADTSIVNFYNQSQCYRRFGIDPAGDYCHWFAPSLALIENLVEPAQSAEAPFRYQNLSCSKQAFLLHLRILEHLSAHAQPDRLTLQEWCVSLFKMVVSVGAESAETEQNSRTRQHHRKLVEHTKQAILQHLDQNLSLAQLADQVQSSPYHLSRIFKLVCGYGLSDYRIQQRLRAVMLSIQQGKQDLAELAVNYGFASHSHLSASFKHYFGHAPSQFQQSTTLINVCP